MTVSPSCRRRLPCRSLALKPSSMSQGLPRDGLFRPLLKEIFVRERGPRTGTAPASACGPPGRLAPFGGRTPKCGGKGEGALVPRVWWDRRPGCQAGPALRSVDGLPSASERGPRGDCSGGSCRAERKPLCPGRLPQVRPWWPGLPGRRRPRRVHSVLCLLRGEEPGGCSGPNGYSRVLLIEQQSGCG